MSFHSNGKVYQLHAQQISWRICMASEISDLLFDEHTSLVIDPAEENPKAEFAGVQRLLLPMHAVMRVSRKSRSVARTRSWRWTVRSEMSRPSRRRPMGATAMKQQRGIQALIRQTSRP